MNHYYLLIATLSFLLISCQTTVTPPPLIIPDSPESAATAVAATLTAQAPTLPPATATLFPTNTPIPIPESCINDMSYIADLTIPDGTVLQPGTTHTKSWRILNNGSCPWTTWYLWTHVQGSNLGTISQTYVDTPIFPNEETDFSITFTTPISPGNYISGWRLADTEYSYFGDTIFFAITVAGSP